MPLQQVTKTTKPEAAKGKPNIEWRGQEHITPGKGVYRPACQERRFVPSLTFIATKSPSFSHFSLSFTVRADGRVIRAGEAGAVKSQNVRHTNGERARGPCE